MTYTRGCWSLERERGGEREKRDWFGSVTVNITQFPPLTHTINRMVQFEIDVKRARISFLFFSLPETSQKVELRKKFNYLWVGRKNWKSNNLGILHSAHKTIDILHARKLLGGWQNFCDGSWKIYWIHIKCEIPWQTGLGIANRQMSLTIELYDKRTWI